MTLSHFAGGDNAPANVRLWDGAVDGKVAAWVAGLHVGNSVMCQVSVRRLSEWLPVDHPKRAALDAAITRYLGRAQDAVARREAGRVTAAAARVASQKAVAHQRVAEWAARARGGASLAAAGGGRPPPLPPTPPRGMPRWGRGLRKRLTLRYTRSKQGT